MQEDKDVEFKITLEELRLLVANVHYTLPDDVFDKHFKCTNEIDTLTESIAYNLLSDVVKNNKNILRIYYTTLDGKQKHLDRKHDVVLRSDDIDRKESISFNLDNQDKQLNIFTLHNDFINKLCLENKPFILQLSVFNKALTLSPFINKELNEIRDVLKKEIENNIKLGNASEALLNDNNDFIINVKYQFRFSSTDKNILECLDTDVGVEINIRAKDIKNDSKIDDRLMFLNNQTIN